MKRHINLFKMGSLMLVILLLFSACSFLNDQINTLKGNTEVADFSDKDEAQTSFFSDPSVSTQEDTLTSTENLEADIDDTLSTISPTTESKFEDVSCRAKIATTVDEFDSVLGNFVDLEHYEKETVYSNADQISSYRMKSDVRKTQNYALDYSVTAAGITFCIPLTCGELEATGWDCREDLASEVESSDSLGVLVSFRDDAGKEFYASVVNRSGATKQLKDCYITGVKFEKYTKNYLEDIVTLSDTAPFVTVCGDIDSNSSLQDVLERLGEPVMIEFYTDGDANYYPLAFVRLTYSVGSESEYGCLVIAIASETDDVMIIGYDHELASY